MFIKDGAAVKDSLHIPESTVLCNKISVPFAKLACRDTGRLTNISAAVNGSHQNKPTDRIRRHFALLFNFKAERQENRLHTTPENFFTINSEHLTVRYDGDFRGTVQIDIEGRFYPAFR